MAKYTVELRTLIESGYDFGLQDYPIFDETYRPSLNDKILQHYKYYEIGQETPARFKDMLNRSMKEIMPYYNQLYQSTKLAILPLLTVSENETTTRGKDTTNTYLHGTTVTTDGTLDNTQTRDLLRTDDSKRVESDTPQNGLSLADVEADLYASYATAGSANTSDAGTVIDANTQHNERAVTGTDTTTVADTENFTRKLEGFAGNQSDMLMKYRQTFVNIDMLVISDLADNFMFVW